MKNSTDIHFPHNRNTMNEIFQPTSSEVNLNAPIKVIGVGGGGSNAVNTMYDRGIQGVDFIICNTDAQALEASPVPVKVQLGMTLTRGQGAGSLPEVGRNAAIESIDEVKKLIGDNTSMVFITAGMGGGTGTGAAPVIAQAAREMDAFIKKYPNSYHLYPAMDMFGALAMASGRFDAATAQFEKTSAGPWPSLSFYGKLNSGKAKLYSGNYDAAIAAFKATEADPSAEGYAIQAKLIAQCLRAQALALAGQTKEGKELVMQIIENESSKNIELFAHANNALGVCFNEEQQTKEAIRAFLKTDLLFTLDPDSHAQALYHLVNLWANSERPDRAASARQKLTQRYRNTYWASKLK